MICTSVTLGSLCSHARVTLSMMLYHLVCVWECFEANVAFHVALRCLLEVLKLNNSYIECVFTVTEITQPDQHSCR